MSRHTWMDRTIETARDSKVVMPWFRSIRRETAEAADPQQQTATARP